MYSDIAILPNAIEMEKKLLSAMMLKNVEVDAMKTYAKRLTGFDNLDAAQFFSPGLYVIGATPAADKTTFCRQELFKRNSKTALTAARICRGASFEGLHEVIFANLGLNLSLPELQDESVDDYIQIVPSAHELTKLDIVDTVRKLGVVGKCKVNVAKVYAVRSEWGLKFFAPKLSVDLAEYKSS